MLFNEPIDSWSEWGAIFQSIEAFTPLAKEIFHREGLALPGLENLTPGTNAVFRAGDYVVKIFAPRESGMEPQMDYSNESAVCGALTRWGISTPRLIAHGMIQDTYLFYYLITEYCPGKEAGTWLESAGPGQLEGFIRQLKGLLQTLHRPAEGLIPPVDLLVRALDNPRLERLPVSLRDEMAERAARLDLTDTLLVHGDLTGENILIGANNRPIIIDCADSCMAPWWYELAPLVFELFHCRRDLLRLFADTNPEVFVEQIMDAVCIHDFGANMLWDLAEREKVPYFSHLTELRDFLLSRVCG
ncbi:aminoglycoside phosphotransferase family protein [Acutalibacter sp. 1XD8-33]|uniref:aminoglycoside phosphotransferase family protein n=1 Tax=Acutalibacter sp. 1XD8-33 TaxID=2320081 RepID=UPI001314C752|nr:aminoglycoside phosphotransferase family protein [Acutalibacter sp. 1XD8-33]